MAGIEPRLLVFWVVLFAGPSVSAGRYLSAHMRFGSISKFSSFRDWHLFQPRYFRVKRKEIGNRFAQAFGHSMKLLE
jgi:hypothetical protein